MTAYNRGQRGWYVDFMMDFPDGSKERVRKKSPRNTRKAAESFERDLRQQMLDDWRRHELGLRDAPTLADFEEEFFSVLQNSGLKASTLRTYRTTMTTHLVPFFGDLHLDEIGPRVVEQYKASRSNWTPKTVRNHLGVLSKVFRVALKLELLPYMPHIDAPGAKPSIEMEVWDDDEESRVLAQVDTEPRIANWIRLALATGLRSGELAGLQWGDIDVVKRQLVVRRQWYKGNVTTPKSNRLRTVPLSDVAIDALQRQKSASFMRGRDWVFYDDEGFFGTQRINDGFRRIIRKAGVKRIRIHDMRHTFATKAVRRGVPIEVLQQWLGHSDIRVTMRYAHVGQQHSASFIDRMNETPMSPTRHREG